MKARLFFTVFTLLLAVLFVLPAYGQSSADGSELDYVNMEINRVYKDLMSTLNPQQQEVLRREERAWIKWRDVEADRIARQTSKCCGDAYQASYINASVKLVKQRTEVLKNYHGASSSTADTIGLRGDKSHLPAAWKNREYSIDCGENPDKPLKVVLRDGEGRVGNGDRYYLVSVDAVTKPQDLTGDGKPETAVLLYCTPQPSNFFVQEVQVFTAESKLLARLVGPGLPEMTSPLPLLIVDSKEFAIRNGKLVTGGKYYNFAAGDSHASGPSIHRILRAIALKFPI